MIRKWTILDALEYYNGNRKKEHNDKSKIYRMKNFK
jgi:hypothetical protein